MLAEEHIDLPLVVVVRLVDSFLGSAPTVPIDYQLSVLHPTVDGPAAEAELDLSSVRTPTGHVVFPRLRFPHLEPTTYHLRARSDYLVPEYPDGADTLEFTLRPDGPAQVLQILLHPAPAYPYPSHAHVAHGRVEQADQPVVAAVVISSAGDRCATDDRGLFSLALRGVRRSQPVSIVATSRTGQSGQRDFPSRDAAVAHHIAIQVPTQ